MKKFLNIVLTVLLLAGCSAEESAAQSDKKNCSMKVATYNLRMDTEKDGQNAWPNRKELVKELIVKYDFDIFGTQEGFKHMLDGVSEIGSYTCLGGGREDGLDAGEHSAIFYKTARFTKLDGGNFWYSETPDQPGLGWDATCCNRICSWLKLKDNLSGKEFFFFNSHFDHQGVVARRESSHLLLKKIKEIAGSGFVLATGDFNATPESEPIKILLAGNLKDSRVLSKQEPQGSIGTTNGFKENPAMNNRIDYIFVVDPMRVNTYKVINDKPNGRYTSDHFPVMAEVEF